MPYVSIWGNILRIRNSIRKALNISKDIYLKNKMGD